MAAELTGYIQELRGAVDDGFKNSLCFIPFIENGIVQAILEFYLLQYIFPIIKRFQLLHEDMVGANRQKILFANN
ncbi:MAG: hypothetical protein QGH63_07170 [Rhodospirillales bacterium]|nr:hypothetical protein [Rhodospirillales bacterium]